MKRIKKFVKYFGLFLLLLFLFRGFIYRISVNYSKVAVRDNVTLRDKSLINKIEMRTKGSFLDIEEIIDLSNELTSKELSFTFNKVSNNTNSGLKKANCIGYSSLFNSIGNFIIEKQELKDKYEFIHLVGEIDLFGFNIHGLFNSPFFADHDFNEIQFKETGENRFVDPSLRDYFRIESVSSR